MRWIWPWVTALFLAVLSIGPAAAAAPKAEHGVIDLRHVDFSRSGGIDLSGEWGLVRGPDSSPAFSWQVDEFIQQPGYWNEVLPGRGNAALVLRVLLPENAPPLALAVPDVNSAWRLYIDGNIAKSMGRLGLDAESEIPVVEKFAVPLPLGRAFVDLVFEISNHHHHQGGVRTVMRIGPADAFAVEAERLTALPLAALGALLMAAFMGLAFYAGGRRDHAFLVFALFTVLVAMRTFATSQIYVLIGHDLRADIWYLPPAFAALFVFPGVYVAFLREMLPDRVDARFARVVYWASGVALSLVVLTPSVFYTAFHDAFMALDILVAVAGIGVVFRSALLGDDDAWWLAVGATAFTAAMINDALHYMGVWQSVYLLPLGFAVFAACYCAALALRMFRSERSASLRLADMNRNLEHEVALRTASLAEAKNAAERASQAKSEFLAVMSHEIRTPLHGWAGLTELLARTPLNDEQHRYVRLLRRTADQLSRLIGNILDLAGMESGRTQIIPAPVSTIDLIEECAALVRAQAGDRGQGFCLRIGESMPAALSADEGAVLQVLRTSLDRFGAGSGEMVLDVSMHGGRLCFELSGPGRDDVESSGEADIGQNLCRNLIQAMGGDMRIRRQDLRTLIGFRFPADECAPPQDESFPKGSPLEGAPRILFADDVELNRLVLRGFLSGAGWRVDEAADGAQAVAMYRPDRYDLIVLDLRMPVMDGFQAARTIRDREAAAGLAPVPIVALSAGAAADRRHAQESGFTLFLAKPIGAEDLIKALTPLLPAARAVAAPPPAPPAGLESLMPRFVDEMEADSARLVDLMAGPSEAAIEHVHAMRGKAGMFGEDALFELLSKLEALLKAGETEGVSDLTALAVDRAGQLRQYL